MQSAYIPVLIYAALVVAFPAVTLVLAKFIRPASTSFGAKLKPYECGIPPESDARGRYSVRFYIVAMLFVILVLFLGILLVGYLWLYKKGALEWV